MKLTADDHARVTAAVTAAEAATDGEILTIVADKSDSYHDVGYQWALLVMLLALAVIAATPGHFVWLLDLVHEDWGQGRPSWQLLTILLFTLTAKFLVARYLLAWMPLRMALTPGATKARRVRRAAIAFFKVGAERRTASRTGVLLYLSLAEHRAEIVADASIAARVPPEAWGDVMADLVGEIRAGRPGDGMVAAIGAIGALLAREFPRTGTDPNELPDRLIEL